METQEIVRHLASLMHLDVDASHVYDEVLTHVTGEDIRASFTTFRDEHKHHADAIADAIKSLGETPPAPEEDLMGRLSEMALGMRSVTGDQGALHAMRTSENYHNSRYKEAQSWDVDAALKETLASFYGDEVKHLAYMEKKLSAPVGR
jgi:hypothetical protein